MEITYCGNRKQRFFIFPASISTTFSQTSIHRSLDLLERPPPAGTGHPGSIAGHPLSGSDRRTSPRASAEAKRDGGSREHEHTHSEGHDNGVLRLGTIRE